jgi:hypothetical protein
VSVSFRQAFAKEGNKCKDSKTKRLEQEIDKLNKKINILPKIWAQNRYF